MEKVFEIEYDNQYNREYKDDHINRLIEETHLLEGFHFDKDFIKKIKIKDFELEATYEELENKINEKKYEEKEEKEESFKVE